MHIRRISLHGASFTWWPGSLQSEMEHNFLCLPAWSLNMGKHTSGNCHSCYHLLDVNRRQFKLKKNRNTFRSANYILLMSNGYYGVCKTGILLYETDSNMAMHRGSEPWSTQTFGKYTHVTKTNRMAQSLSWGKLTVTWHIFNLFTIWENKFLTHKINIISNISIYRA